MAVGRLSWAHRKSRAFPPPRWEPSSDPRVGATPLVYPLDGRVASRPVPRFIEDEYVDNIFFVAWGDGDNLKSTGGTTITPEESTLNAPWFRRVIFWPEVGTAP